MSNNKQSSVEFLTIQLIKNGIITNDDLQQANAMHKEEIMEAHYAPKYGCFSEQYYNETYGGGEQ